ncbi:MAG: S53 family peptidase [Acidimicrobiia bacterium]|nr:S53 family peptidase [Acidimicrobiia bacterium]
MTRLRAAAVVLITLLSASAVGVAGMMGAAANPSPGPNRVMHKHRAVCGLAPEGVARCNARIRTGDDGVTAAANGSPAPGAYGPADLQSAYNLPSATAGAGQTVAIVDAYDQPNVEADLAAYRSQYGLPACTTANGCFRKINEQGASGPLPGANVGWGQEISLDVEMVSAICPNCHIVLVEANSAYFSDLGTGENTAARLANAISNSYGGSEARGETADDAYYNHPGVAITVSSGDGGYGVEYPASSGYVTAVGGTSLVPANNSRGWTESAWSGAGSGCSGYEPKPAWQTDTGCNARTVADVSAVADPNTGVAVYDSYGSGGSNWYVFGGTSVASPIIAAVYALGGNTGSVRNGSTPYANPTSLFDVVSGSNGSCGGSYLCSAQPGYDGPTGLGTPDGTGAFGGSATPPTSTTTSSTSSTSTTSTTKPPATTTTTIRKTRHHH